MRSLTPYERFGEANPDDDALLEEYSVKAGDTISGIAHRFYGDWRLWRLIADRNSLIDVRQLVIGMTLLIPPKPLEQGRYEST